jgi:type VI secretion system protein ImpF
MALNAKHITPSLLDRLTDENRKLPRDTPKQYLTKLKEFKESVLRDVSFLLNARTTGIIGSDFPNCARSVLAYGLPDITSRSGQSIEERGQIRREIQSAIERFEPRLKQVYVKAIQPQPGDTQLRFSISAALQVDPEPEPIFFDTVLDSSKSQINVIPSS